MKKLLGFSPLRRDSFVPQVVKNLTWVVLVTVVSACSTTPSVSLKQGSTNQATEPTRSVASVKPSPTIASAIETQGILSQHLPQLTPLGAIREIPQATDPLRPGIDLPKDHDPHADLWSRVRRGFNMTDLDNNVVRGREQWYATRPDYVDRMTQRGGRYLFHILEEVERRNMPTELALLPFIESAFNPEALSSAKASGMWQFMPATGKDFDLKQNIFRDDRRNVLASTRAALDYLKRLYGQFGDWHLALAAYNWGEGNVQRAINRNRKAGLPTDYSSLRMPLETQQYVPKLQAVKNIVANPELFGLRLPPLHNHPYFLSVPIDRDMDIEVAAKLANLPLNEFKALNPQMNKPVVLAAGTPQILLPYDNANLFVRNIAKHRGSMASWTAWVAPKTIRPADAARQWGMSEVALREINKIPPKMLVKAGSTLLVSRTQESPDKVAGHIVDNASMALTPEPLPLRRLVVKAKRKDTMNAIAQRYRVTTTQLANWNELSATSSLKAGQSLVLFLPRANNTRQVAAAKPTVNTKSNLSPGKLAKTKAGVSGASPKVNVASNGR